MNEEIKEEWRDVPGYENLYKVSNLGKLYKYPHYSTRGRYYEGTLVGQYINHKGYFQIHLYKDGKTLSTSTHRLVAQAFIPNIDNKPQINHINCIKTDNRVENLEWVTNLENMQHAVENNLFPDRDCEDNGRATFTNKQVSEIKTLYNSGWKIKDIAKEFDIPLGRLRTMMYGFSWEKETTPINKRDERKEWDKEHVKNSLLSKIKSNSVMRPRPVQQVTKTGEVIATYRSPKEASLNTGISRRSIHAVASEEKFYNKDKTSYWTMKEAGGYIWKRVELSEKEWEEIL
jgi:hypothetical protein